MERSLRGITKRHRVLQFGWQTVKSNTVSGRILLALAQLIIRKRDLIIMLFRRLLQQQRGLLQKEGMESFRCNRIKNVSYSKVSWCSLYSQANISNPQHNNKIKWQGGMEISVRAQLSKAINLDKLRNRKGISPHPPPNVERSINIEE